MEPINVSVLNWTTNPRTQHHRRRAAYGQKYRLPTPIGYIYPFQISRPTSSFSISSFKIIRDEDGAEFEVINSIRSGGLSIVAGDGFDMIKYLGTVPLPGDWEEGLYYCRMADAFNVWYSDYFCMVINVEDYVKVEWRHSSPIPYRDGIIDYEYPYRNYIYLDTDIGFPRWPVDQEVELRNGIEFPVRVTTWKEYRFKLLIPEYLGDVFRMIRQHDDVKVYHLGRVYDCELFRMEGDPNWGVSVGDVAEAEFIFRTGTVVTTTAKSSLPSAPTNPNQCVPVRYVVNRILGFTDFGQLLNNLGSFGIVGDNLAVNGVIDLGAGPTGSFNVVQITHLSTTPQRTRVRDAVADDVFFDISSERYFVHTGESRGFIFPGIYENNAGTISGYGLPGATAELWTKTEFGQFERSGVSYSAAQIRAGVSPDLNGITAVKLVFLTQSCGLLQESSVYYLDAAPAEVLTGYDYDRYDSAVFA